MRFCLLILVAVCARAEEFELAGRILPPDSFFINLYGATSPFKATTYSELNGRFRFRRLPAAAYTLIIVQPGGGEIRRTVEVGPSLADGRRRVNITIDLRDVPVEDREAAAEQSLVSVHQLAISKEAQREYDAAEKRLEQRDVAGALQHLDRAVAMEPRFSAAWNVLGTIAYQRQQYADAEADFRRALDANPESFEALVNLGGVLINLRELEDARKYNSEAVRRRPKDALANSQLGIASYYLGSQEQALKYLKIAKRLDPAHFSQPQRLLAEIYVQRKEGELAAAELEDLLKQHPDIADAADIKARIAELRDKQNARLP